MNIVNKVTLRHLRKNKRRTVVTIIGTIISVAMITAVATLAVSFMDLMQRQTIANEGEWHVLYKDVNGDQLEAIKKDSETKALVISRDRGYAYLEGSQNETKPYLFVKEYNAQGFQQFPITLSRGRLPEKNKEVVISEELAAASDVNFEIGDQLMLEIGERSVTDEEYTAGELTQNDSLLMVDGEVVETLTNQKTVNYTIVGFIDRPVWEPTWAPGYTMISYVDESFLEAEDPFNASVVLKNLHPSLYSHAQALADKNNIETVQFNNRLLRYYGLTNNDSLHRTLYSLAAIIMAVIIIGSVALIYNAFAISVSERSRHLGMLASVGATKRQKRNSVFFEGIVIALISIPVGIGCGLTGIGVTFMVINSIIQDALGVSESLTVVVTPLSIIVACAVSLITILLSTFLPAVKASKVSAIDAIRQTADIKLTRKAVKTSKWVRAIFGVEAEIALKNLKRNRRRYQVTIFSLVVSIILFLSVSFFTSNLKKSLELSQEGINFDLQVYMSSDYAENEEELSELAAALEEVTEVSMMKKTGVTSFVEEVAIADELKETVKLDREVLIDGKYPYYVDISGMDEQSLQIYANEIGADMEKLTDLENPGAIIIDTLTYKDMENDKFAETKAIHAAIGDQLDFVVADWEWIHISTNADTSPRLDFVVDDEESDEWIDVGQVEIVALTDQYPMGVMPAGVGGVNVIVSEKVMDQLFNEAAIDTWMYLYLKSSDPLKTQQQIEELKSHYMSVHNLYQSRQREEQMVLLMSVFTYGFIVLITVISIANIFNTISTSISLRKREFAMLKSVGMTPHAFNKMIHFESIFYGIKALLYGIPLSMAVMYLMHRALMNTFSYGLAVPWSDILYAIAAVFAIVSSAMLYSIAKVKKENIIDALKQENI
ncbi:putative ABC transport system permease protein [Evansella caseinilytica]|uniref:Putative ABC transport system permease protein n=1 Tax=Evansella caseinilytica TaxID=1503961 RepID=A0A1H3LTH4_9BACI|nr:ABC transporter permease [Evansella caseinilytica]SDY67646.1 putative ABC transport system permease protein [Evansella caseinilytica]